MSAVEIRHFKLVSKIRFVTDTAHEKVRPDGFCGVHREPVEAKHVDPIAKHRLDHTDTLLLGKKRIAIGIDQNTDRNLVESAKGFFNDILMSAGDRIKTTRNQTLAHT